MELEDSILTSIKKLLGIEEEVEEFDVDIMMNINAALATLRQLGVGPLGGAMVNSKYVTYGDIFGDYSKELGLVGMYLFYKTRLGFDPPASSVITDCIKEMIRETEWRLNIQVDPPTNFESEMPIGGLEDE